MERQPDAGIIHPAATDNSMCYPVSMARKEGRLLSGDWVVVPYVKNTAEGVSLNLKGEDAIENDIIWTD